MERLLLGENEKGDRRKINRALMDFSTLTTFIANEDRRLAASYEKDFDVEKRSYARMVKLTEEVGELAVEILAKNNRVREDKSDGKNDATLGKEFADVIITTLLVAKSLEIDVYSALEQKIEEIEKRQYRSS